MPRRNYRDQAARRRNVVAYEPAEVSADYEVLMTNGSGVKTITLTGTQESVWRYATRLGLNQHDDAMPGVWWPIDTKHVRDNAEMFAVVS